MEWIVVDENARLRVAHQALNLCIENILKLAKTYKIELVYAMTAEKALHKRYTKYHGMTLVENDVKTFLKNLTETNYKNLDWISDETQIKKQKEEIK